MKHDIFISYSRKDTAIAERICAAFDKAGITYFIDRLGIGGGFEFPVVLAEAIVECKVVLFLASENSYESKFTNSELTFAFNEKPRNSILPYIIDGSKMPVALRFIFSSINWRTIETHPIETVLVDDILQLIGRERQSAPGISSSPAASNSPAMPRKTLAQMTKEEADEAKEWFNQAIKAENSKDYATALHRPAKFFKHAFRRFLG